VIWALYLLYLAGAFGGIGLAFWAWRR